MTVIPHLIFEQFKCANGTLHFRILLGVNAFWTLTHSKHKMVSTEIYHLEHKSLTEADEHFPNLQRQMERLLNPRYLSHVPIGER